MVSPLTRHAQSLRTYHHRLRWSGYWNRVSPQPRAKRSVPQEPARAHRQSQESRSTGRSGVCLNSQAATGPPSEAWTARDRLPYFNKHEIKRGGLWPDAQGHQGPRREGHRRQDNHAVDEQNRKRLRGEVEPTWLANIRKEYTIVEGNPHVRFLQPYFSNIYRAPILTAPSPTLYRCSRCVKDPKS